MHLIILYKAISLVLNCLNKLIFLIKIFAFLAYLDDVRINFIVILLHRCSFLFLCSSMCLFSFRTELLPN